METLVKPESLQTLNLYTHNILFLNYNNIF